MSSTPTEIYGARAEAFAKERDALTWRWNRIANVRLVVAVAGLLAMGYGIWSDRPFAEFGGLALIGGFAVLAGYHAQLGRRRRRAATLEALNEEALQRVARAWGALPEPPPIPVAPDHPFAFDLDLFGHASLFQLLRTTTTPMGDATLAGWLLAPAAPEPIRERQTAAAELAPAIDLRDEIAALGRLLPDPKPDPAPFLAWAEDEPWLARRRWLPGATLAVTALLWGAIVASVIGAVPFLVVSPLLLLNLVIGQALGGGAYGVLTRAASQTGAVALYGEMLRHFAEATFRAPLLRQLQSNLGGHDAPAHDVLRRLQRLTSLVVPKSSMLYLPMQALTLWDVHVLWLLERWQEKHGQRARGWFTTLGEAEALAALAALGHANPTWAFPDVDPQARCVTADGLGHPLLGDDVRVDNDVEVGPSGTFLLVTGSNMSGKSTLLRAIGVNVVLAGAGGPVCARSCRVPPVDLWTSIRVQDSLERGVSYFMAELQRLKQIVDAAGARAASGEGLLLYLLDEILHGTNTAERQIAARRIVAYLVGAGAIGAVTTHDLALADAPELHDVVRPIHFTETVATDGSGPAMTFDYKIRSGVAPSTNALKLMELVGFDLPEPVGVNPSSE